MEYNFEEIEKNWQQYWEEEKIYEVENNSPKPKYYVLDMFPYPSGAGIHVGHPLGYTASDILSRFKRMKGFNVLHPMGFDAFGLPAEQYAIQTGQHPAVTTAQNIKRYKEQLKKIAFSFDWSREVTTSDPKYYKWTQWIFLKMFNAWFNKKSNKAETINELIKIFEKEGNQSISACTSIDKTFTAEEWKKMSEKEQQQIILKYRLAYLDYADVNWCPALGTVLANDEVKDGVSERGGHPVIKKSMRQWFLRTSAYADRLLSELDNLDWSDAMKEMQRNWIGKSEGATVEFRVSGFEPASPAGRFRVKIFTTRPDTIFGSTFMVLAPEHELVKEITTAEQKSEVEKYIQYVQSRSERDRLAETKKVTGAFTGAYVEHPFTGEKLPIWISEYVLAGYGTGAIMAVPAHDSRDYAFAKNFKLPIKQVVISHNDSSPSGGGEEGAFEAKEGKLINSDFLNDLEVKEAIKKAISIIEEKEIGKGKTNYRLRDAAFSRQRYWGEPFPIYYKDDVPYAFDEKELPLILPEIESYKPTEDGEAPLARAKSWKTIEGYPIETDTMPGYAGSNWYFFRYMDPHNEKEFASKEALDYWQNVDFYVGGTEHATGHLLYSRFCTHVLHDLGFLSVKEPYKKLVNQGMIQGTSKFIYRLKINWKVSPQKDLKEIINHETQYLPIIILISKNKLNQAIAGELSEEELKGHIELAKNLVKEQHKGWELIELTIDYKDSGRLHVPIKYVENNILFMEEMRSWAQKSQDVKHIYFITEDDGKYICGSEVEKMSKSKYNVVNPDDVIDQYGADTFRMYEMFLGPIEMHKPWDTQGIDGVHRFLKKLWRLFFDEKGTINISEEKATDAELKILHKTIKKIEEDIEKLALNTGVSALMICVNELAALKCNKKEVLESLLLILAPFAPHICEELWQKHLKNKESIVTAAFPKYNEEYIKENTFQYPIAINGKTRAKIELAIDMPNAEIEKEVLSMEELQKWLEGKQPKKVIIVPRRMINLVV